MSGGEGRVLMSGGEGTDEWRRRGRVLMSGGGGEGTDEWRRRGGY